MTGKRIRRAILDDDGQTVVGFADGTVTGYLPVRFSDFVSSFTGNPAALWNVKYDPILLPIAPILFI